MLSGAVQQWLKAQGLSPVHVGGFGDYSRAGAAAWAVTALPGADVAIGHPDPYDARLQLRTRAADMVSAEEAARTAMGMIRGMGGQTLLWTSPVDASTRSYRIQGVRVVQRPQWFPTQEAGEETSANFDLFVSEL